MTRRVDLRSDTVTQPTQAMRDAMAEVLDATTLADVCRGTGGHPMVLNYDI